MPSRTTLQLQLQSADGYVFDVHPQIYKCFKTITSMMEARTIDEHEEVTIPNVNGCSLWKVLRWAEYHMDHGLLEANNEYPLDNLLSIPKQILFVNRCSCRYFLYGLNFT